MGDSIPKTDVCILSSGSLSSGPRVVKEADALTEAGFSVHVAAVQTVPWMEDWDRRLAARKKWTYSAVKMFEPTSSTLASKAFTKVLRSLGSIGETLSHEAALSSSYLLLLREAYQHPARLYVGHNLAALPVTARAARRHGGKFAFDAEDDHLGELADAERDSRQGRLIQFLEKKYLPACVYVSAASDGIARALSERYGIPAPKVLHNVFSLNLRDTLDGQRKERGSARLSIYWYSQTIGLNRGLQDLLIASTRLRGSFEIHLRGSLSSEVKAELLKLVPGDELKARIHFHGQVHPDELLSRTSEHDVGVALEQPVSQNRLSTVTNKLFFYFLGGLAVVATETPGQTDVVRRVEGSGELFAFGDTDRLAMILQRLHDDEKILAAAKQASRRAADILWNWEKESSALVTLVRKALS